MVALAKVTLEFKLTCQQSNCLVLMDSVNIGLNSGTDVEQQNLSKFTNIKGVLKSAAATAISGVAITSDNHHIAIGKYGGPDAITEILIIKLQGLPRSVANFFEVKRTSEQIIEKLLRQLDV